MENTTKVLVYIPARSGSKRISGKNIRQFLGKPLISYAIEQALSLGFVDKVIVDTDSQEIAGVAKECGAEVPFLRPAELAQDDSKIIDSILYTLKMLKESQQYEPTHLLILQTTSPLREVKEIEESYKKITQTDATCVVSICHIHPKIYHLNEQDDIELINGSEDMSTNAQAWPASHILNGAVFITQVDALKDEISVITKKTKAVICPCWSSVDLDNPEDWAVAEVLYNSRSQINQKIEELKSK